jgi:hypothetical protein
MQYVPYEKHYWFYIQKYVPTEVQRIRWYTLFSRIRIWSKKTGSAIAGASTELLSIRSFPSLPGE